MTRLPLIVSGLAFALTLGLNGLAAMPDDGATTLARSAAPAPAPMTVAAMVVEGGGAS